MAGPWEDYKPSPESPQKASEGPWNEFKAPSEVAPASPKKYGPEDIPGAIPQKKAEEANLPEKAWGAVEAGVSVATSIPAFAAGMGAAILGQGEEGAAKTMDYFTYQPRSEAGKERMEQVGDLFQESGLMALTPGMTPHIPGIGPGSLKYIAEKVLPKGEGIFLKDKPKPVDPAFAASKMKPEESVSQAIKRQPQNTRPFLDEKGETSMGEASKAPLVETAFKDKQTGEITTSGAKHNEAKKTATAATHEQGFIDEQGNFLNRNEAEGRARQTGQIAEDHKLERPEEGLHSGDLRTNNDPRFDIEKPLAATNSAGEIKINEEKANQDFHSGFKYIFEAKSPTGLQKQAVFKGLGIDQQQFSHLVTTPEEYHTFLKAHEESHVANGDHAAYPRTAEGTPDLMHPDALKIETRATQDALNVVKALREKEATTLSGVIKQDMTTATVDHPTVRVAEEVFDTHLGKDVVTVVKESIREIRANDRLAEVEKHATETAVPEEAIRTLMTRSIEEKSSRERLEAHPDSKHIFSILDRIQKRIATIGEQAKKYGLIDGLRENYITHVLDFSKSSLTEPQQKALHERLFGAPKESKLVKDFTAERKFEFLRELEKAIEGTGVVVHTDIAKIAHAYEKAMNTAIVHKKTIDHLKVTNAADGISPYIRETSAEAQKLKYQAFQGKGSTPLDGLVVHPDIVDVMKHIFEQNDPELLLRALGGVSHLTKALNTVGSFFHATSLGVAHLTLDPVHAVKSLLSGGAGERKAVEAFKYGENADHYNPKIKAAIEAGDTKLATELTAKKAEMAEYHRVIDGFMRNGLMAGTEDIQRTVVAETGKSVDKVISRFAPEGKEFKIVQHATEPLDKLVLQKMNKFTWDYMHTGQKLNLSMHLFAKAVAAHPEIPEAVHMQEIARTINNTFGGLDWLDVASQAETKFMQTLNMKAMGIRGRAWGQVALFAPDWTFSTVRAMTTALPKEMLKPKNWQLKEGLKGMWSPAKQGDYARRYVLNTALAYVTLQNGINLAMSGHPIWENDNPTRIDLGDGTTMQIAKHSMETAEWVMDPERTLGNKLGFWPKAAAVTLAGVKYPSPHAPKLQDNTKLGRAIAVANLALPFQVGAASEAPKGEAIKRSIASAVGTPIYGKTPEQIKEARKEGKAKAAEKQRKMTPAERQAYKKKKPWER